MFGSDSAIKNDYVDVEIFSDVNVDLRYATLNNFTGEKLYGDLKVAYLHRDAAIKLKAAALALAQSTSDFRLLVLDALRPVWAQQRLWNFVKDTPAQIYVADPDKGSIHNFGLAVDLTIADSSGHELDMGTPFDSFKELAQPRHEDRFLRSGELNSHQISNRLLLRNIMTSAGFLTIPHEWWHFNATTLADAKARYRLIE
jgi:D-alanyl-D-alanine dipeptidase